MTITKKNLLATYRRKRNFNRTSEPEGEITSSHEHPLFVVQKHKGRNLHYDFRLEDGGILKSWALPKGPSTDPGVKRLAVQTEDHPLAYATFEGVIPQGNYGAGPVMVWDQGTFKNLKEPVPLTDCIKNGEINVWLEGKKLKGGYALIKTHFHPKDSWLLVKMNDKYSDRESSVTTDKPNSVLTHKTLEEINREDNGHE
jgi:bifunctional non-homologous end joining protein LigD